MFAFMVIPLLDRKPKIIVSILYALSLFLVILSGFFCTAADPTDPALKESLQATILSKPLDYKKYPKICKICKNHVNLDTKHCRECNRCVLHFDHHCKWLNNCIGRKNYRHYSVLLLSFQMHNLIILITGGFTLEGLLNKGRIFENFCEMIRYTEGGFKFYVSVLIFMEIMSALAAFAMIQLIGFHVFLAFKGITTYEYILSKRKKSEQYKIPSVKVINEREIVEEVPLEEVYEPYMENPQFKASFEGNDVNLRGFNRVVPSDSFCSKGSRKEQSSTDNINETMKN